MLEVIEFFLEIEKLKFLRRRWGVRGVSEFDSESSADHAFRLTLMVWFFAKEQGLNVEKVIKMALIHDLCNIYLGETTPYDNVLTGDVEKDKQILAGLPRYSKEEKEKMVGERRQKEEEAFEKLLKALPNNFRTEIKELWLDYEKARTPEGRLVRQLDRIEPLMQALDYKEKGYLEDLNVYWFQAKEWLDNKELIEFLETLDDYYYKILPEIQKDKKKEELVAP